MNELTHILLLCLQNEGRSVRFDSKDEIFYFKPNQQDWKNLENLNLVHQNNVKLTQRGIRFQPVTNAPRLDNSGLNSMLVAALQTATDRLEKGSLKLQDRTIDTLMNFVDVFNKSQVSETYQEDLPAEIQAAVDVLEQEIQEEQKEEVVEKEKKTRKKKTA